MKLSPTADMQDILAAPQMRGRLYWLLADGLLRGVRAKSWLAIPKNIQDRKEEAGDPLAAGLYDLSDALNDVDDQARLRLDVEHTRLFAGLKADIGLPPPFESAWRTGGEAGEIASDVAQAYGEAGFADIDVEAGPPDHLAVELKFMALLAFKESEALANNDYQAAIGFIRHQRDFVDRHLLGWVPRWTDALAQETRERLYWALARMIVALPAYTVEALIDEEELVARVTNAQ